MSNMMGVKSETGSINVLLIPLILSVLFFFGALGFGVWAFIGRQDYKTNSDDKAAAAVTVAIDKAETKKDNEFLEKEKEPLRSYKGSSVLGNIVFNYPKTWSVYSKETDKTLQLLLNPAIVSGNDKTVYALKVEVTQQAYDTSVKTYDNDVKTGKVKATAFRLEKLSTVLGARFDGEIATGVKGTMIILPLRDKTIRVSTESQEYVNDLNKIILPSFTFSP